MSEGKRWTVMLWGDSGVGKTTLLTAAVYATGAMSSTSGPSV